MNREQYLAKRMWLHGMAPDAGCSAEAVDKCRDEVSSVPATAPAASLADYYRRFHCERTRREEPPR